ncbi:hypothetical protein JHK87_002501 [Glycine soja]|nr:hypothetical protein JHK87_002501 [Glycine soja]KAG5089891.1 hypothetical protein JHK86_002503 [Glycine max]
MMFLYACLAQTLGSPCNPFCRKDSATFLHTFKPCFHWDGKEHQPRVVWDSYGASIFYFPSSSPFHFAILRSLMTMRD